MKNNTLKFKSQHDKLQVTNAMIQQALSSITQQFKNMKKMHDGDVVCYQQSLAWLKEVGNKISEALKMFPDEVPDESVQPTLVEQVQSISNQMVKYIHSSINARVLRAMVTIKSWYTQ